MPKAADAPKEYVVFEEVWSDEQGNNVFDSMGVRAAPEETRIPLCAASDGSDPACLRIHRICDMTPLDISYKSNTHELYDGTGHLIWLAATAFIYVLHQDIMASSNDEKLYILPYLEKGNQVLELGAGTGAAGIALKWMFPQGPSVVLTDNDDQALELCQKNIQSNLSTVERGSVKVARLWWGKDQHLPQSIGKRMPFDTILATDVVYDLKMIRPLLETVDTHLRIDGHFILSHVPRFCLPTAKSSEEASSKITPASIQALEEHIVKLASYFDLQLVDRLVPGKILEDYFRTLESQVISLGENDSMPTSNVSSKILQEYHSVIMVFQKQAKGRSQA